MMKTKYQYRLEHGMCTQCGAPNDTDTIYCSRCRNRRNELHRITVDMRIAMGICTKCGKKDAEPDHKLCLECMGKAYKRNKESREFFRSINICPICQKNTIVGDEKSCLECRAKLAESVAKKRANFTDDDWKRVNEQRKIYRANKIAQGICGKCGCRPLVEGLKVCQVCRNKRHELYERGRFEREEAKRIKRESGLCYFCDKPVMDGMKVCEEHYAMVIKNSQNEKVVANRKKLGEKFYKLSTMKKAVNK